MRANYCCAALMSLTLLGVGALAQQDKTADPADGVPVKTPQPALDVTYIGNEGFLIQAGGKKVLVDALFDGQTRRLAPSPELLAQMTGGSGLFADVDLLLVTHRHGDHFNPKPVTEFLRHRKRCRLIAHTQVVDLLRKEEGFAQIQDQIHEVRLESGSRASMTINGIALNVLGLDHAEDRQTRDLAFIVNLGGTRFLHVGDATVENSLAHLNAYPFGTMHVDVLFLEYFDQSPATQQFIGEKIKPSQIVAMHILPAELEEESKNIRAAYPHAIIFKLSMERLILPIDVDFHSPLGEQFWQTPLDGSPQIFACGVGQLITKNMAHPPSLPTATNCSRRRTGLPSPITKNRLRLP